MSRQTTISLAVAAVVGVSSIALVSSDAMAYRGDRVGVARVGGVHGGAYRGRVA